MELSEKQFALRHVKEKSEAAQVPHILLMHPINTNYQHTHTRPLSHSQANTIFTHPLIYHRPPTYIPSPTLFLPPPQELVQRIESGLSHIGDLLGVEKREEDQTSSVGDLLRDIETALDTVLDEREKQLQQQAGQQGTLPHRNNITRSSDITTLSPNITHHLTLNYTAVSNITPPHILLPHPI